MKDSLLFEFILAEMLHCRDDSLDERDQREAILDKLSNLMIEVDSSHSEIAALEDTARDRIRRLDDIKQAAKNLLGAADDGTWKRMRQALVDAIDADQ